MKLAYLASRYPSVSHTFIAREVAALRANDFDVHTFTIRRTPGAELLSDADRKENTQTHAVLPAGLFGLITAHLIMLFTSPAGYVAAMRLAMLIRPPGVRAAVWQLFYFAEAAVLARQLSTHHIKHIHAHFANVAASVASLAAKMINGTWSVSVHGYADFGSPTKIALAQKIKSASLIVCISDHGRTQAMMHSDPSCWPKIVRVYCGINPSDFKPKKAMDDASLSDLVKKSNPIKILSVGRLSPEKGQTLLLRAISQLKDKGIELQCVLVGDGPARAMLENLADELEIASSVTFAGAVGQDEIQHYYDDAAVFVLSSLYEGLPVVLMEAMAKEVAVIAPHITGIPELVDHSVSGLLVRPGSSDALAKALEQLILEPDLCVTMGRKGRERICQHFDNRQTLLELCRYMKSFVADGTDKKVDVERSTEYTCSQP